MLLEVGKNQYGIAFLMRCYHSAISNITQRVPRGLTEVPNPIQQLERNVDLLLFSFPIDLLDVMKFPRP